MTAYEVRLAWDGVTVTGLTLVGPLRSSTAVVTLFDGALNRAVKVPGRPDTAVLTLQREVDDDLTFDLWARSPQLRKEAELSLVDAAGGGTIRYRLHQCWVSEYAVEADVGSGQALESITLALDSWERATAPVPALADRLAARQQRPVVRVGLGRLVGETVPETQQRLDAVLRDAERAGAVLVLDEADALFGRRTEIGDAHDRYTADPLDTLVSRLARYPFPVLVVPPG